MAAKPFSFCRTVACLCSPSFAFTASLLFVSVFSVPFYQELGVDLSAILVVVSVTRSLEVSLDPFLAGHFDDVLSEGQLVQPSLTSTSSGDTTKSHLRIPALLRQFVLSVLLCAAALLAHCTPPSFTSRVLQTCWYAASYGLFTASFSFVSIPVYAIMCTAQPYRQQDGGSTQLRMSIVGGILESMGLAFALLVGYGNQLMMAQSSGSSSRGADVDQQYSSCYSASGTGYSCLNDPGTNRRSAYHLFSPAATGSADQQCASLQYDPRSCSHLTDLSQTTACVWASAPTSIISIRRGRA